jgi:hypothetical protein
MAKPFEANGEVGPGMDFVVFLSLLYVVCGPNIISSLWGNHGRSEGITNAFSFVTFNQFCIIGVITLLRH